MNYECVSTTGTLSATAFGECHSTNEWYHIIRDISSGDAKQWKNVVTTFKQYIASGELVKSKKAVTGSVPAEKKTKAACAAKIKEAVTPKAKPSVATPVKYQVADMEDERIWSLKRKTFSSDKERDEFIAEVNADKNMSFVSKGWDVGGRLTVSYWEAKYAD